MRRERILELCKVLHLREEEDAVGGLAFFVISSGAILPGEEATALELGKIDMALLKAVAYGHDNEEDVTHSGYIVALRTSGIADIADLEGKRFGVVRDSAGGMVYPISYLAREGLDYRSDFLQHRCYRNQHELIEALHAGGSLA